MSYSDIQMLPDLCCYATLPGPYPAVKLTLKYEKSQPVAPAYIERAIDRQADERLTSALAQREKEVGNLAALFVGDGGVLTRHHHRSMNRR